jgi:hypothetical protein
MENIIILGNEGDNLRVAKLFQTQSKMWWVREFIFTKASPDWSDYFVFINDLIPSEVSSFTTKADAMKSIARKETLMQM